MSQNTALISDIAFENEASHSSEEEDVRTLEKIKELPGEDEKNRTEEVALPKKRKFLEDEDLLDQSRDSKNLATPLLGRTSTAGGENGKRGISLQQFKKKRSKKKQKKIKCINLIPRSITQM